MAHPGSSAFAARALRGVVHRAARAAVRARKAFRTATALLRLRPTYLVIGAQKAGTTSLHRYLSDHPAVLCAVVKETEFFNRSYAHGKRSYRAFFPLALRALAVRLRAGVWPAVGEATAAYLFDPRVPERVHAFDPRLKLVAILRDPVDRAYSHFQMERRWGREPRSLEGALENEERVIERELERIAADPLDRGDGFPASYVARGRYAEQLERWLAFFPPEQLLVLTSDELLADPEGTMARVARFLGIPVHRAKSYPREGVREYEPMSAEQRERLARIFEPHNRRLEELLGRKLPWTRPGVSGEARSAAP